MLPRMMSLVVEGVAVQLVDNVFSLIGGQRFMEIPIDQFVAGGGMSDARWSRVVLEGDYCAFVNVQAGAFTWSLRPPRQPDPLGRPDPEDYEEVYSAKLKQELARRAASPMTALDALGLSEKQRAELRQKTIDVLEYNPVKGKSALETLREQFAKLDAVRDRPPMMVASKEMILRYEQLLEADRRYTARPTDASDESKRRADVLNQLLSSGAFPSNLSRTPDRPRRREPELVTGPRKYFDD